MRALLAAIVLTAAVASAQTEVGRELIQNGSFSDDANHDNWPDGWSGDRRAVSWAEENGNRFVRLANPAGGEAKGFSVGQSPKLDPNWFKLKVSLRLRLREVVRGQEGWHDARVAMSFHAADGTQVGGWPPVMNWTGSRADWTVQEKVFIVPEGAAELRITPALFYAVGEVDFDDLSVTVVATRPKLEDGKLPAGVRAEWGLDHAWKRDTATRGRVCLNGLWRFIPVSTSLGSPGDKLPPDGSGWGWLKVPAAWPGRGIETVRPLAPDIWELRLDWTKVEAGWYQRDVTVPESWRGRRCFLELDYPQTESEVFVAGKSLGSARWPGGAVELTDAVPPGATTRLTIRVTTDPLEKARMVAMREDLVEQVKAEVRFRGLVGDVFLTSQPRGPRITGVQTRPSVRGQRLGLACRVADLPAGLKVHFEATAKKDGREGWRGQGEPFDAAALRDGLAESALAWPDPELWDLDRPVLYDLSVRLVDEGGKVLDEQVTRFGFRELWLDGRELMLNGTPVHLRALVFNGLTRNDAGGCAAAARLVLGRMRELGFNFVILSNYGLSPGETSAFGELLEVCDELGFGVSFSLPHALRGLGGSSGLDDLWRRAASYAVETAGNHPSVLAYGANHNALGYHGDQNPLKIDGVHVHSPEGSAGDSYRKRREIAAQGEAVIRAMDPTRELYHHQSGNMGAWHTVNIYLNWAPAQERSEWLSHWATAGVKPLFFVEWGPPHQASWGGHRQGPFIWRNKVNSEPLGIEYGAMHTGDSAYRPDPAMERYVDRYEQVYARRQPFHISEVLGSLWAADNELNNIDLKALHTDIEWPRLRTWGITAMLPWDQGLMARATAALPRDVEQPTDWDTLQRPGRAPDYLRGDADVFGSASSTWELTSWGRSLKRWNQPLCCYLAGSPKNFCERSHNVRPGDMVTKQVMVVNDRREAVKADYTWRLLSGSTEISSRRGSLTVAPGARRGEVFTFGIPARSAPELQLELKVEAGGEVQTDALALHVVEAAAPAGAELALWDPEGISGKEVARLRQRVSAVSAGDDVGRFRGLVVGRQALTLAGDAPDLMPLLRRGGRVLVLEQTEEVLTRRLGFRTNDPSLRETFPRVPGHPVLAGLDAARLADWRGDATLLEHHYELPAAEMRDPPKDWLGFDNTRVWKWGNAGQVTSVVIEKPQRGDFLTIADGGFDLQYAPLLLQRVGGGEILYCQMDVSGRTLADPAADRLLANLLTWCGSPAAPPPAVPANIRYLGDGHSAAVLRDLGLDATAVVAAQAAGPGLLIVGRQSGAELAPFKDDVAAAVAAGGTVLALDQDAESLRGWLPFEPVTRTEARTVSPVPASPLFAGLGPGDLHWRGRREVVLIAGPGGEPNVLAEVPHGQGRYVFCQILPFDFDYDDPYRVYLKRSANHTTALLARILAGLGVTVRQPTLAYWREPPIPAADLSGAWQAVQDAEEKLAVEGLTDALPWRPVNVPGTFESQVAEWAGYDGVVWYRRSFTWTGPCDRTLDLLLGGIDDEDWTWVNGQLVGHIGRDTHPDNYWSAPRRYALPPGTLRPGANQVVVKVRDLRQSGGITAGVQAIRAADRWLASYYVDQPAQLDDPYRYNRW